MGLPSTGQQGPPWTPSRKPCCCPEAWALALNANWSTSSPLPTSPSYGEGAVGKTQEPLRTKVPGQPSPAPDTHRQERGALRLEPTPLNGPAVLPFLDLPQHPPPRFSSPPARGSQIPLSKHNCSRKALGPTTSTPPGAQRGSKGQACSEGSLDVALV